jgi:N-acetylated-alpha-linked acidic dipeptidase
VPYRTTNRDRIKYFKSQGMKKILIIVILVAIVQSSLAQPNILGFFEKNKEKELRLESAFDGNLNNSVITETIRKLSAKPHHIGSPGDKENAEYILSLFKSWGWDAKIETYYVLFPTPVTRILEMTSPVHFKAGLKEPAIKEDATSGLPGQLPTFNAYSADGDVTAELVNVNYGLPEDYEVLHKMGIDVKGKIVIAKYGRSWRGIKPKVAQEHGAIGCIIYSDPTDDGYFQGDVYPKGSFRNEYEVQRGSIIDMPIYPGDPLTPGTGARKDAKRLDRSEAGSLLKIPVLPIGYHDAAPLLEALGGPCVPADWHGGLPFAIHTGPGKTTVHLKLSFDWEIVPCYDVVAKISGSKYPDEWIIRGNHHDAWVFGAADPISGLAAMLEEARSFGELLKSGWRPDRTLVYCAWDGEEPGLLGSTEWVEDHEAELKNKAVIYINSDSNGRGFLYAQGSQALEPFMDEVAKQVTDPETNVSVFERRKAVEAISAGNTEAKRKIWNERELTLEALGSGSDFSSFIQHAGIPSINLGYGGEDASGDYHSIYDSYSMFERFKDPSCRYGVILAQTAGRMVLRMAGADLLPFDFTHLYRTIDSYSKELESLLKSSREKNDLENLIIRSNGYKIGEDPTKGYNLPDVKPEVPYLDFSPLQNALHQLEKSTDSLNAAYRKNIREDWAGEAFNQSLFRAEQQLLNESGLPRRPWYKHTIYAPGLYTGYDVKTLPGIREAIEQNNWDEAQQQIETDATFISRLARYLMDLSSGESGDPLKTHDPGGMINKSLGGNVFVFDPGMDMKMIQNVIDSVFARQSTDSSEFSTGRYAFMFRPGRYQLDIKVDYYMQVIGLGDSPEDVVIEGTVRSNTKHWNSVLTNFWRSAENLTVIPPADSAMVWGVSQAAPLRRVHIKGNLNLFDKGYASGGFLSDSKVDGTVSCGPQQQWFTRNTDMRRWAGGNWNMMFVGVPQAPAENWPEKPYTVIGKTPLIREKPFLAIDEEGFKVEIPGIRQNSSGPGWTTGSEVERTIRMDKFYIAKPGAGIASDINKALQEGKNILLTPGRYFLDQSLKVKNAGTLVIGTGFASLIPVNGTPALEISDVNGVIISGITIDASKTFSEKLFVVGEPGSRNYHVNDPVFLYDIFFRVGGPFEGTAGRCMEINSNDVCIDHTWIWRADHGKGVGWEKNRCANGLVVNGDNVTIYGLFNEHFQEYQTLWNGNNGRVYFYQSEMPYDPPSAETWKHDGINGYASYKVSDKVANHEAWGLGIYNVFYDAPVIVDNAIETPAALEGKIHHKIIFWLNGNKKSIVRSIINGKGGSVSESHRKATMD